MSSTRASPGTGLVMFRPFRDWDSHILDSNCRTCSRLSHCVTCMYFTAAQWEEISTGRPVFSFYLPVTVPGSSLPEAVVSSSPSESRNLSQRDSSAGKLAASQSAISKGKTPTKKTIKSKAKKRVRANGSVGMVSGTVSGDLSLGVTVDPAGPSVVGPGREVESNHGPPGNERSSSLSVVQCALNISSTKTSRTEALQRLHSSSTSLECSEHPRVELHGTGGLSRVALNQNSDASGARPESDCLNSTLGLPSEKTPFGEHSLDPLSQQAQRQEDIPPTQEVCMAWEACRLRYHPKLSPA